MGVGAPQGKGSGFQLLSQPSFVLGVVVGPGADHVAEAMVFVTGRKLVTAPWAGSEGIPPCVGATLFVALNTLDGKHLAAIAAKGHGPLLIVALIYFSKRGWRLG